jgi:hypothetical protein
MFFWYVLGGLALALVAVEIWVEIEIRRAERRGRD